MALYRAAVAALEEFGYRDADVKSVERLPMGVKNLNYRVRAGGRDWVLKCHQGHGAGQRLEFSQRLELTLADAGLPVLRPTQVASGKATVETTAGLFTLHPWVEGRQISIDQRDTTHARHPDLARSLGMLIGEVHRVGLTALPSADPRTVDVSSLLSGPRRTVRSIRYGRPYRFRKTLRLRLHPRRSEFGTWILRQLPSLRREAARLPTAAVAQRIDSTDVVLAHNDVNWENLIFDDEFSVLALLDFDNAAPMPRSLDVGAAAAVLVGAAEDRLAEFLDGYVQAAGVRVDESAVLLGMRWKCLRSILFSVDAHLSDRIGDTEMVATWCRHLHECQLDLPPLE